MPDIIIVSNRLPVIIDKKEGELYFHRSAGGLATGLASLDESMDKKWVGWPGDIVSGEKDKKAVSEKIKKDNLVPVFLSKAEVERYYEGFSNETIWPLFHYFTQYARYDEVTWKTYKEVNKKFAKVVCGILKKDSVVWIHDYQLLLLPALIRKRFPDISIGFFLHIPFPSYEMFRLLPWREEILSGLLGADQIGFHTFNYMRHFLSSVYRITGSEHSFGKVTVNNRLVNVDVFPMGIDYEKFAFGKPDDKTIKKLLPHHTAPKEHKWIISIDRLDYTKGIPQRIKAFERFLKKNKHYHEKVTLMLVVVPSRSNVEQYRELKEEIETAVGRINGRYRTFNWTPLQYYYRAFPFAQLLSIYKMADLALITPLRDGMNLVAKEYVACKQDKKGVLILSEMAGASYELMEALIINPQDENDIVRALEKGLQMPPEEQKQRLEIMQQRLQKYNVKRWAKSFIRQLGETAIMQQQRNITLLTPAIRKDIINKFRHAKKRLLLLDYDGTLMNFQVDPASVEPDKELLALLKKLKRQKKNRLALVSGRDHQTMERWFRELNVNMTAEHGAWNRKNGKWQPVSRFSTEWKKEIASILENMVQRTPGSFIEEKKYSLVWHYRKVDKELGEKRIREFLDELLYFSANNDLQVLEGNKVIEIKNSGINKGVAAASWLAEDNWDFALAIGDDHTDEDMFKAMPAHAFTFRVGLSQSAAKYNLLTVDDVRDFLYDLVGR